MADVKIKRTTSDAPSSLEYGSLGIANNRLYYGDSNNKPIKAAIVSDFKDLITAGKGIVIDKPADKEQVEVKVNINEVVSGTGINSTVLGLDSEASGKASIAIGFNSKASKEGSTAIGNGCVAIGGNSLAIGTACAGYYGASVALGSYVGNANRYSVSIGRHLTNDTELCLLFGQYNEATTETDRFILADGASDSAKHNFFKITKDSSAVYHMFLNGKEVALAEQLPTANPNPSGGGTTQLVTLKIDGTTFNISQVAANPSTSTTNTLNKIEIDGVAYNLPSGGSSDVAAYLSSTYLSSYNCSLEREATMWTVIDGSNKYGSFTTRGYIIAGSAGSGSLAGTAIGPNGLYKYNSSTYAKMEFKLPNTAGTLVTSDETITYVTCSISSLGATRTVTLTNDQLSTIVLNYMRVGIVLNVTGNNSAYGFYFSKKAGTTLYFATPVLDGIYYVAIVTGSTVMNISMKQLMTD